MEYSVKNQNKEKSRHDGTKKEANMDLREVKYTAICEECMSEVCAFNPNGICMFPAVYGRRPEIKEEGCLDCLIRRGVI